MGWSRVQQVTLPLPTPFLAHLLGRTHCCPHPHTHHSCCILVPPPKMGRKAHLITAFGLLLLAQRRHSSSGDVRLDFFFPSPDCRRAMFIWPDPSLTSPPGRLPGISESAHVRYLCVDPLCARCCVSLRK